MTASTVALTATLDNPKGTESRFPDRENEAPRRVALVLSPRSREALDRGAGSAAGPVRQGLCGCGRRAPDRASPRPAPALPSGSGVGGKSDEGRVRRVVCFVLKTRLMRRRVVRKPVRICSCKMTAHLPLGKIEFAPWENALPGEREKIPSTP